MADEARASVEAPRACFEGRASTPVYMAAAVAVLLRLYSLYPIHIHLSHETAGVIASCDATP